nr:MAG TPA: hypothetical protein [Caudoviricetes sp.]
MLAFKRTKNNRTLQSAVNKSFNLNQLNQL